MKFLIVTEPDDSDALLVKIALENLNHTVRLYFSADMPTKQRSSVYIDNHHAQWHTEDDYETFYDNDYDVVWWRRARKPFVPIESAHPDDYRFVLRENQLFYESLTSNLAPLARWINPKDAALQANFKLHQLKIATQCGMLIPKTLFSNNPDKIREFIQQHEAQGVIYKAHCANFWFETNKMRISYTSKLSLAKLPEASLLSLTPGIYQKEVQKKYELRIVYFGGHLVAAKLNSQSHDESKMDWRAIDAQKLQLEPYSLPDNLAKQIRQFMRQLGLVFGSLDFIVTPEGDYVFLEVNEQGQFLWLEEFSPDLCMLDIFINFLLNPSNHFHWNRRNKTHSIKRYSAAVAPLLQQNMQRHVDLNNAKMYAQRGLS